MTTAMRLPLIMGDGVTSLTDDSSLLLQARTCLNGSGDAMSGISVTGLSQKLNHVILPRDGPRVGTVAMGFFADGQKDECAVPEAFAFFFGDTQLWRVDEVVGG